MLEGAFKWVSAFNRLLGQIGMLFVIPLMLLTTADVISRDAFGKPIPGTFELSEYLLSILIFLGAAYTQQVKGHVGVDFLTSKMGRRAQLICSIITNSLCLFITILLSKEGLIRALQETTVSDMLRIPQAPFRSLVFVAGITLSLEFIMAIVKSFFEYWEGRR